MESFSWLLDEEYTMQQIGGLGMITGTIIA